MNDTENSTNCLDGTIFKDHENNREHIKRIKDNIETVRFASKKENILALIDDQNEIRLQNFDSRINKMLCHSFNWSQFY
jgi:hypothetical protein